MCKHSENGLNLTGWLISPVCKGLISLMTIHTSDLSAVAQHLCSTPLSTFCSPRGSENTEVRTSFPFFPQQLWCWSVWYRLLAWAAVWRHEVFPISKLSPKQMPNHKLQVKFQFLGIAQVSALIPTLKNPRGCKMKHVLNIYNTHRASYSSRCFETVTEGIY